MCSTVPLFRKVILQSGTVPGNAPPVILDTKEGQYQRLLSYCGIDKDDPARLERLRQVPVERLVAAVADFDIPDWGPWAEKGFFPAAAPDYNSWVDLIGQCTWVDEVIVGDCCFEVGTSSSHL
jgi:carboxylesterase type B